MFDQLCGQAVSPSKPKERERERRFKMMIHALFRESKQSKEMTGREEQNTVARSGMDIRKGTE